jgi:hypothetical protein
LVKGFGGCEDGGADTGTMEARGAAAMLSGDASGASLIVMSGDEGVLPPAIALPVDPLKAVALGWELVELAKALAPKVNTVHPDPLELPKVFLLDLDVLKAP